jgi:hypothetical protein
MVATYHTVVDTEIVQRLGTYFPAAGGQVLYSNGEKVDNSRRDLQVTTLDRYTGTIADPTVKTWTNVTYADNYYQGSGAVSGLTDADWNQQLTNLGDGTAFDWYLGTVNNNLTQGFADSAYVRDGIQEGWAYAPLGGHDSKRKYGDELSSVTANTLPSDYFINKREDLKQDNTATPRQRGDFAVPTLFDGNFDAISSPQAGQLADIWFQREIEPEITKKDI